MLTEILRKDGALLVVTFARLVTNAGQPAVTGLTGNGHRCFVPVVDVAAVYGEVSCT